MREQSIVRARYGLDGHEQTLRQIAARLGLSAERIRQIEERGLEKLRIAATGEPPPRRHPRVETPGGRPSHRSTIDDREREVVGGRGSTLPAQPSDSLRRFLGCDGCLRPD